jgi:uncharacterized protein (TIRG00374 family)
MHEPDAVTTAAPASGGKSGRHRLLGAAAAIVFLVVVFAGLLPRLANYGQVWDVVTGLDRAQLALLLAAAAFNVVTFAPPWMAALPGLSFGRAMTLTQTSTARASAVPGGDAVGLGVSFAMLRAWGFRQAAVTVSLVLVTLWNQLMNIAIPAAALGILLLNGESQPLLQTACAIGLVVGVAVVVGLVLVMRGDRQAETVGRVAAAVLRWPFKVARRGSVEGIPAAFVNFRHETLDVLHARWLYLTVASLVGHLSVFLVLIVSLRVCGVTAEQVSWPEALASWGLVRLLTAVPITPGGLGVIELGMSTALIGFGGNDAAVVAAVLIYRVLTYLPTIVLGLVLGINWRRHGKVQGAQAAGEA